MVTNALIHFALGLVRFLLGLIPNVSVPDWMTGLSDVTDAVFARVADMGVWIPWTLALAVLATVLACVVATVAVKGLRIVFSFFTGGGGSAS